LFNGREFHPTTAVITNELTYRQP